MRGVATLAAFFVAALTVASAILVAGSVMRDVASARVGAGVITITRAAPLSADVVRRLDGLVAAFPGNAGVWIADLASTTPLYAHNADTSVVSASLYKLGVLMEAERRVENGTMRYSDHINIQAEDVTDDGSVYEAGSVISLDEALEAMITVSDNSSALAVWHLIGGEAIDATLARAGMTDFHVTLDRLGNTTVTPRAVGTYFALLARKELVSARASERMLARLERQRINDRLPAALPGSVVVAHKTGNLSGLIHDSGVIFTPAGPRVVVVMTWDAYQGANAFIAQVAVVVYGASLEPATRP